MQVQVSAEINAGFNIVFPEVRIIIDGYVLLSEAVTSYLVRYSDSGGEEQRKQASQPRAVRRHRGLQVGLRA